MAHFCPETQRTLGFRVPAVRCEQARWSVSNSLSRDWLFAIVLVMFGCASHNAMPPVTPQANRVSLSDLAALFPDLAHIPGATFLMGSPIDDKTLHSYRAIDRPQREVSVPEFWMARCLITAAEFSMFLNDAGNHGYYIENWDEWNWDTMKTTSSGYVPKKAAERCPANRVTSEGAAAYCAWLTQKTGHPFRLPTEAEWELAARGPELRAWPWGDEPPLISGRRHRIWGHLKMLKHQAKGPYPTVRLPDPTDKIIPFYDLYGARWNYHPWDPERPWIKEPVGSFPLNATPQGVYDMLDRAGQWCADDKMRGLRAVKSDIVEEYNLLEIFLLGDAAVRHKDTPGRSWSRVSHAPPGGGLFRVVTSSKPGE